MSKITDTQMAMLFTIKRLTDVRLMPHAVVEANCDYMPRQMNDKKACAALTSKGLLHTGKLGQVELTAAGWAALNSSPMLYLLEMAYETYEYLVSEEQRKKAADGVGEVSEYKVRMYRGLYKDNGLDAVEVYFLERERVFQNRLGGECALREAADALALVETLYPRLSWRSFKYVQLI